MRNLELVPVHWLGWEFRIVSAGRELTTLTITRFRDRATFTLEGSGYRVQAKGVLRPTYRLERGGSTVARAETRGLMRPSFTVTAADRTITLRRGSLFSRTFSATQGPTSLGEIRRTGLFTRRLEARFDERIDPACQIFLLFLVQVEIRRESRRSS